MASVGVVLNGLVTALNAALVTISPSPSIGRDEPPPRALADLAKGEVPALISVFDLNMARNTTRWMPFEVIRTTATPAGVVTTISAPWILPSGSETITLSGSPIANDAVSCVITTPSLITYADVVKQQAADTLATYATRMAAAINADSHISLLVNAVAVGAVITLTNLSSTDALKLHSKAGNIGTRIYQWGTSERSIQVSVFTQTSAQRQAVGDLIFSWAGKTEAQYGVVLSTGEWAKVQYNSDRQCRDTHQVDIYRWDFVLNVEHGITTLDILYTVLATIPTYQLS